MKFWSLLALPLFAAFTASAQPEAADYTSEVTLSGGIAPATVPFKTYYRGGDMRLPYYASLNYHYNLNEAFQLGIAVGMTEWQSSDDQHINTITNPNLASQRITYVYAERAFDVTARANWVIPTYNGAHQNSANFYVGVAAGAVFTLNNYGTQYAQAGDRQGPEFKYLRQYNYNSGTGFVGGIQAGFTKYLTMGLGLNVEVAPRYAYIKTINADLEANNENFGLLYFPVTIGLRVRF